MFSGGLVVHIDNALGHGATAEQITEVLEIVSLIGVQTLEVGVSALHAELRHRRDRP